MMARGLVLVLMSALLCFTCLPLGDGLTIDAPIHQTVVAGTRGTIQCAVTPQGAEQVAKVVWKGKNYRTIPTEGRYAVTHEGLTIDNVAESDSGLYVCQVQLSAANSFRDTMLYYKYIRVTVTSS